MWLSVWSFPCMFGWICMDSSLTVWVNHDRTFGRQDNVSLWLDRVTNYNWIWKENRDQKWTWKSSYWRYRMNERTLWKVNLPVQQRTTLFRNWYFSNFITRLDSKGQESPNLVQGPSLSFSSARSPWPIYIYSVCVCEMHIKRIQTSLPCFLLLAQFIIDT